MVTAPRRRWFAFTLVAVLAGVVTVIGYGAYLGRLYDSRRDADEAILKRVNLEVGLLSREGYVYHVVLSPPVKENFRDADLRHLAEIQHLEILWIQDLPFTDRSLKEFAKLQNLRSLVLAGAKVTNQGVDQLRNALPQTKILVTPAPPATH